MTDNDKRLHGRCFTTFDTERWSTATTTDEARGGDFQRGSDRAHMIQRPPPYHDYTHT